ncbi:hypothetical protein HK405_005541, partial [Cladochytrium tenue]
TVDSTRPGAAVAGAELARDPAELLSAFDALGGDGGGFRLAPAAVEARAAAATVRERWRRAAADCRRQAVAGVAGGGLGAERSKFLEGLEARDAAAAAADGGPAGEPGPSAGRGGFVEEWLRARERRLRRKAEAARVLRMDLMEEDLEVEEEENDGEDDDEVEAGVDDEEWGDEVEDEEGEEGVDDE